MKSAIVYDENYSLLDYGAGHPMRGDRYGKAMEVFEKLGLLQYAAVIPARLAEFGELALFHDADYIAQVKQMSDAGFGALSPDTPVFHKIYEAFSYSAGGTLTAIDAVASKEYEAAFNLSGGWHHAKKRQGRGFCVFNDIAVGVNYLKQKGYKRIMIIDYDAHHGDGTQEAFYSDKNVFTISIHQDPATNYPYVTGYVSENNEANLNIPLPAGTGDSAFISLFEKYVVPAVKTFAPEFVLVQMGVDGLCTAIVASLALSYASYAFASQRLGELAEKQNFGIVFLGGGGFVHPYLGYGWGAQIAEIVGKKAEITEFPGFTQCVKYKNQHAEFAEQEF